MMPHKSLPFFAVITSFILLFVGCKSESPCQLLDCNNGNCVITVEGEAVCDCFPGYFGEFCENYDACLTITCNNGGTCVEDAAGEVSCECPPAYMGDDCSEDNPCFEFGCENGGTCMIDEDGQPYCECVPGFTGPNCQFDDPCVAVVCPTNATCEFGVACGGAETCCICIHGWEGTDCDIEVREKYLGVYNAESNCEGGIALTYVCEITPQADNVAQMLFNNFHDFGIDKTVYGVVVESLTFSLPTQTTDAGIIVRSTNYGLLNTGSGAVLLDYDLIESGDTTSCSLILTPQ